MNGAGLRREVGRWDVVALGVNGTIGGGIYFAPALVAAKMGAASPWAFLGGGLVVLLIVLCMAEAASYFEEAGGVYLYARTAFGELVGVEVGFLAWLARTIGLSSILVGFAQGLSYLVPAFGAGVGRAVAIVVPVLALAAINVVGVKAGARTSTLVTLVKLVPLGIFVVAGLFAVQARDLVPPPIPPGAGGESALLILFAYVGFESVTAAAGEFRNPRRDLPFALIVQIAVVTIVYVGVQYVAVRTLPTATSQRPLADAAQQFLGRFGGWAMTLGAAVS